jgi:predicted transcriptional regulator
VTASVLNPDLSQLVSDIVAAYVSHHEVDAVMVPELIRSVYGALADLDRKPAAAAAATLTPAVPIKKSVFPDYIVCLEDGQKMKTLKRHLKVAYNLEPDEYRAKWGLPKTYPMVAPNYSEMRSGAAKQIGLGRTITGKVEAPREPMAKATSAMRRSTKHSKSSADGTIV